RSVRRNRSYAYWKSQPFVLQAFRRLQLFGERIIDDAAVAEGKSQVRAPVRRPSNCETLRLVQRLISRYAVEKMQAYVLSEQFFLAYGRRQTTTRTIFGWHHLRHLTPPRDREWADPFPIRYGDSYLVFFE